MKYRAFLSLTFIFFSILPSYVHANLDTTGKVEYSYTCENGIGILKVQSLSGKKIIYTNTYRINHAGYVYSQKPIGITSSTIWFGIDKSQNYAIPGCGCPESLTDPTIEIQSLTRYKNGDPEAVAGSEETMKVAGWNTGLRDTLTFEPIFGGGVPMSCENRTCGNGVKDSSELCDPKDREKENWGEGGCSVSCVPIRPGGGSPLCGDGIKDTSELCDPKDREKENWGEGGCSVTCEPVKSVDTCGNGVKDSSELCDPNDREKESWGVNGCSRFCTPISADNAFCGDGLKQGNELCDPNDMQKLHWGKYGCDSLCKRVELCTGDLCNLSLTGVSITSKKICFEVRNAAGKYMTGLQLVTTLTNIRNTYVKSVIQTQNAEYAIDSVQVVGDHYCATLPYDLPLPPGDTTFGLEVDCIGDNSCMITHPGGALRAQKKCTGKLQVFHDGKWTDDEILYDTLQEYRVVVNGSNPECTGGVVSIRSDSTLTATGGTLSNVSPGLSSSGTFMAMILQGGNPLNTYRGITLGVMYTTPGGGYSYGLTTDPSDFTDTPLSILGNKMAGLRVIGSLTTASDNRYNMNTENIVTTTSSYTSILGTIQKNVASLTRGVTAGEVANGIIYHTNQNLRYSTIASLNFKTIIVYGNLIIDQNIPSTKGIIVLKDTNGNGGNVIVSDTVKTINAVIFTEGIFRGASMNSTTLNPASQLVLKGALYSRNTIGGSADPNNLFLHPNTKTTNKDEAFIQDLNNVRSGTQDGETYLGYRDPFIIHYDSAFIQNPPPGF